MPFVYLPIVVKSQIFNTFLFCYPPSNGRQEKKKAGRRSSAAGIKAAASCGELNPRD
jgi:hypothetical protein